MLFQPQQPVLVKIIEEPVRETTVVDVLLGAIGLTGVLILIAVLCGALLGGLFVLYPCMVLASNAITVVFN